jgi:hypothetical protein
VAAVAAALSTGRKTKVVEVGSGLLVILWAEISILSARPGPLADLQGLSFV